MESPSQQIHHSLKDKTNVAYKRQLIELYEDVPYVVFWRYVSRSIRK